MYGSQWESLAAARSCRIFTSHVRIRIVLQVTCVRLPLALLLALRTRNNSDGNKLMIFSDVALYYGDTYPKRILCSR